MFKALGTLKKGNRPPSDDLIHKHKDQISMHELWTNDVKSVRGITSTLADKYKHSKGGFAPNRYEHLKDMIKTAIAHWRQLEQEIKTRPRSRSGSGGGSDPKQTGATGGKKLGLISKLKMSAQGFADTENELQRSERDYSEMSTKEVEAEIESLRKEVLQLKQDFYTEKDKLVKLTTDYEESKKLKPAQRYTDMKNMIKVATRSNTVVFTGQN